jgi:uncharacterized protein YbjT (DUF2867 family)
MILVVGATGTNGREVAVRLAGAGRKVRALIRSPEKATDLGRAGVELVQGDLDDAASLDAALRGAERAFIVTAVDRRCVEWFRNCFEAAKRAGTRHVVKFSGMGAGDAGTEILRQHGESDEMLRASGLPCTILQPNSFHQNMLWSADAIRKQSQFYLPVRDGRQSLVDVRDIATIATLVLTESGHEGKTYEITGPESLSYEDVAATLSKVLGRTIRYVDVPPQAAKQAMLAAGMPEWNAAAVTDLYGVFATGRYAGTTDVVERLTGKPPTSFEQFARDHAALFA